MFRTIEKYCEVCGVKLFLHNNRDVIRKRFCSLECRDKDPQNYLTENGRIKISEKNRGPNSLKGHSGDKNPNWKGGGVLRQCLVCRRKISVCISRYNKGYGKWCSRECYDKHHRAKHQLSYCFECHKEIDDLKRKNRKFVVVRAERLQVLRELLSQNPILKMNF